MFYPKIRTKNSSARGLRKEYGTLPRFSFRSIVRLGSTTMSEIIYPKSFGKKLIVEINSVESIQNSRSKLRMKECFAKAEVPQAEWWTHCGQILNSDQYKYMVNNKRLGLDDRDLAPTHISELPYPILVKRIYGYKGRGMEKLNNQEEFETWINNHSNTEGWYFEKFHNYTREYRLHCSEDGCFYACRKMLKSDADNRWFRNDSNCVWILEENELFDKPINWGGIERNCVEALKAVGLKVGAFDVKVQSATTKKGSKIKNPKYIIIEVNSAPSFGEITLQKYIENLPKIIENEYRYKIQENLPTI